MLQIGRDCIIHQNKIYAIIYLTETETILNTNTLVPIIKTVPIQGNQFQKGGWS